jgi:hypothetical protein
MDPTSTHRIKVKKRVRYEEEKTNKKETSKKLDRTSYHFIRSPSSPTGSIESLGSLFEVLSGYTKCYCLQCTTNRKKRSLAAAKTAILSHFQTCPQFKRVFEMQVKQKNCEPKDFEKYIIISVSHLCKHNCFLRAFSPARRWHELRTSISHYGNISPDKVLKGWSCILEKNTGGSLETGLKPKVTFVAPNGRAMDSGDKVLKVLGFIGCSTQRISGKNTHPPLRRLQFKDRSVVEAEIIDSVPMYGIQCTHDHVINTCARRTLHQTVREKDVLVKNNLKLLDISPFGLIEELFQRDPWKLLISTILLNRTHREQVDFVMFKLLEVYGNAAAMERADPKTTFEII